MPKTVTMLWSMTRQLPWDSMNIETLLVLANIFIGPRQLYKPSAIIEIIHLTRKH